MKILFSSAAILAACFYISPAHAQSNCSYSKPYGFAMGYCVGRFNSEKSGLCYFDRDEARPFINYASQVRRFEDGEAFDFVQQFREAVVEKYGSGAWAESVSVRCYKTRASAERAQQEFKNDAEKKYRFVYVSKN